MFDVPVVNDQPLASLRFPNLANKSDRAYILATPTLRRSDRPTYGFILDKPPTAETIAHVIGGIPKKSHVMVSTLDELRTAKACSLPVFWDVAYSLGKGTTQNLFWVDSIPERNRRFQILALGGQISGAIGPLDDTLLCREQDGDTEQLKQRLEQRSKHYLEYRAQLLALGVKGDFPDPTPEFEGTFAELRLMKKLFLGLCNALPYKDADKSRTVVARLTHAEQEKFGYVHEVSRLLGANLIGVCAYGSSVFARRGEKFGDYDNWVVVHDLDAAYESLGSFEQLHEYGGESHPVHLLLLPSDCAVQYLRSDFNPLVNPRTIKPIFGNFKYPKVEYAEILDMGWLGAVQSMLQRRSGALRAINDGPGFIINTYKSAPADQKSDLFNHFCESSAQLLVWAYDAQRRNSVEGVMSKRKMYEVLERNGISLPKYPEDAVTEAETMKRVSNCLADSIVQTANLFALIRSGKFKL